MVVQALQYQAFESESFSMHTGRRFGTAGFQGNSMVSVAYIRLKRPLLAEDRARTVVSIPVPAHEVRKQISLAASMLQPEFFSL